MSEHHNPTHDLHLTVPVVVLVLFIIGAGVMALQRVIQADDNRPIYPIANAPYNAKCNGQDDDGPAIQAAIVEAEKLAQGGIVQFPDNRTCVIKSRIIIKKSNIYLRGAGDGRDTAHAPEYRNEGVTTIDYTTEANKPGQTRILVNTATPNDGDAVDEPEFELPSNHPMANWPKLDLAFEIQTNVIGTKASGLRFVGPRVWYRHGGDQPQHRGKIFAAQVLTLEDIVFDGVGYAFESQGPANNGGGIDLTVDSILCINWGRQCLGTNKDTRVTNSVFRQNGMQWDGTQATYQEYNATTKQYETKPKHAYERWAEYAVYSYSCDPVKVAACRATTRDAEGTIVDYNFSFINNYVEGLYIGVQAYGSAGRRSGYTFRNNRFTRNRDAILGSNLLDGARWQDVTIEENEFIDNLRYDVYLYNGENFSIKNNLFLQTPNTPSKDIGVSIKTVTQTDQLDLSKIKIENNHFNLGNRRNWSAIEFYEKGGYALASPPYASPKVSQITIANNIITNVGDVKYGAIISFQQANDGYVGAINIRCNDFVFGAQSGATAPTAALRFGGPNANSVATIRDLQFTDNNVVGNEHPNVYGVLSDTGSQLKGGAFARNVYTKMDDSHTYNFQRQNVSITQGSQGFCSRKGVNPTIIPGPTSVITAPTNTQPTVHAGDDRTLFINEQLTIDATVADDGLPSSPGAVTVAWSKVSGPGTVTFGATQSIDTVANFSALGTYVLKLTASDGAYTVSDEVTITVVQPPTANKAPTVSAGPDVSILKTETLSLVGTMTDDGLPDPPRSVSTVWSKVSGPGTVTFLTTTELQTTATFSQTGSYVLKLTANDSALTASDELTITVTDPPVMPGEGYTRYFEAEDATLTPSSAVKTDETAASGGKYVSFAIGDSNSTSTPHTAQNTAKFTFTVPTAGTYTVWARFLAKDAVGSTPRESNRDSYWVSVVKGTQVVHAEDVYDMAERNRSWGPNWQWSQLNGRGTSGGAAAVDPRLLTLTPGEHTLIFRSREANARLDRVYITNELASVPVDAVTPARPVVTLTKATTSQTLAPNDSITYTLTVRNEGDAPATHVVIKDPLPDGMTYIESYRDGAIDGNLEGSTIVWRLGTLVPDATTHLSLTLRRTH